jgi:hypothetical protein
MGEMQNNLKRMLVELGYNVSEKNIPIPSQEVVNKSEYENEVNNIYNLLGGIKTHFPLNLKKWDLEVDDFAVELDEYLHFNRYRLLTLNSNVYKKLPKFPHKEYLNYCKKYEGKCLCAGSHGGKWSNSSCEAQFGPPSNPKDLNGNGAPRWKQRAFYDFVKDLSPFLIGVSVVRLSIWDELITNNEKVLVKDVLSNFMMSAGQTIYRLLKSRA